MKVVLNKELSKRNIVSKSVFIVNDILPIAIKQINDYYKILFICHQDNNNEICFLSTMVSIDNEEESKFLSTHSFNINNFEYNAKLKYLNSISNMNKENGFNCDFNFHHIGNYPLYMECTGYSKIDDIAHYRVKTLYFPRDIFIKISKFFNDLLLGIDSFSVFTDKTYNDLTFVNIKNVNYIAMAKLDEHSGTKLFHYDFCSDDNIYPVTIFKQGGKQHLYELSLGDYNQKYSDDSKLSIKNIIKCDDIFYIIHNPINGKRVILKVPKFIMTILFEGEIET